MISRLKLRLLIALWLSACPLMAQQAISNDILFLFVQVTDTSLSVEKVAVRPGKLKMRPATTNAIKLQIEVSDRSEAVLWQGESSFPTRPFVEYVDADGHLQKMRDTLKVAHVLVRVPHFPNAATIALRRVELTPKGPAPATPQSAARQTLLARFDIQHLLQQQAGAR